MMGVIERVVIQPVLWVVCIILPLFSGSLSSYPSFPARGGLPLDWELVLSLIEHVGFTILLGWDPFRANNEVFNNIRVHNLGYTLVKLLLMLAYSILPPYLLSLAKPYILVALRCSIWLLRLLLCTLVTLLNQSMIFVFKNRRSCQVLLLVASVLIGMLGSSRTNVFQAIPLIVGFILAIPDFDLEPGWNFRFQFTRFVIRNMDEDSIKKLLDSKHCKILCCNEMMPSLADLDSPVFSCFVKREDRQICDSTVNARYEIGLGSVTTSSNEHEIDVVVSTPCCGSKKMTMRNTALSRYNLHKSAEFWRDNPRLGILNYGVIKTGNDGGANVKRYCIGTREWIWCCGMEGLIFMTSGNCDQDV